MPATLNCPNCGAASSGEAAACDYCGSRLVAVACAVCFSAMFVGAQFCPHCGAKAEQAREIDQSTLRCPGCGGEMRHEQLGGTTMHACGKCGSAWLTPETFTRLCADREARGAAAASSAAAGRLSKPKPFRLATAGTRYVRCPVCDAVMNRVNFGDTSGVIVDTCATHGIWFERDELHAILTFVEQGGLARRRMDEQDRRRHLQDVHFESKESASQRAALKTLIVQLDRSERSSDPTSWSDLLKAFFQ